MINFKSAVVGTGCCLLLALAGTASAGNGNKLFLLQEKTGIKGNTLSADQSGADNSLVGGFASSEPAVQKGSGNIADLRITGTGGVIQLLQNNSASNGAGNNAKVNVSGSALATVGQIGSGNAATLSVLGDGAKGAILQNGVSNKATLKVSGTDAKGAITQNGKQEHDRALGRGRRHDGQLYAERQQRDQRAGRRGPSYTNGATVSITQTTLQ